MAEPANPRLRYMAPNGPFKFGMDVKGGLMIEWNSDVLAAGFSVPMGLLIQAEHTKALLDFLVAHKDSREMLAAVPPTRSTH